MVPLRVAQVLSYDSGISELPLLGDTIGTNLDRTVARYADREALVDVASPVADSPTAEFAGEVTVVALGLVQLGIGKGDRVGIWAPNVPEWVLVQYATAKIGAILVNINPAYRTHELEYVLNQSGIRTFIAVPQFKTSDYAAMICEVRPRCPAVRDVILIGHAEWADLLPPGERPTRRGSPRSGPPSARTTRSTSNTRRARPASPKARRSAITTS